MNTTCFSVCDMNTNDHGMRNPELKDEKYLLER